MHKEGKLKNKLKYILAPLHETQAVTALVMVKVGSRDESAKVNGISHFIEHLMFKGTKKRPTSLQISQILDGIGADYNAFTSKQYTGYYIKANKAHLELAMEMLSELVFEPLFNLKEIERERGVIIEEINMYEDNPLMYIGDVFEDTIFKGHALGRKIIGPESNIRKLSRAEIINYYKKHYLNDRIIIGLSGNFEEKSAVSLLEKYFNRSGGKTTSTSLDKFKVTQKSPRANVLYRETKQVQLALGFPSYHNTHPKLYAMSVLAVILGGGMSSRLFTEIREKRGLCYFVKALTHLFEDTGALVIQAGLDQSRLELALKTIKKELIKISTKPVSKSEIKRAKEFLKGKLILQLEDSADLIGWLVEQKLLTGKVETLADKLKKIDQVKIDEVQAVAKEIFNFNRSNLALIGPFKNEQVFLNILKA